MPFAPATIRSIVATTGSNVQAPGNAVVELIDQNDAPLYSFFNADRIFDFLLSIGMRPFVELSFMPGMLTSTGQTIFRYRANVSPPNDFTQWEALIAKLVGHWVARYGAAEVREWFFEVWNEPNLDAFWTGGQDGYFALYRTTATENRCDKG